MAAGHPFNLTIDGQEVTPDVLPYVVEISLHDSLEEIDLLTLRLNLPVDESGIAPFLTLGAPWSLTLGGEAVESGGELVQIDYSISADTPGQAVVRGLSALHRLRRRRAYRHWDVSHHAIAETIAKEYGLKPNIQSVNVTASIMFQENLSDAAFLKRLARLNNYYVRARNGELQFGRMTEPDDTRELILGDTLLSFEVTQCLGDLPTKVVVSGWDVMSHERAEGSASASDLRCLSGGALGVEIVEAAFGEQILEIDNVALSDASACQALAIATLQTHANTFVSATATARGLPWLRSGLAVDVRGAGPRSGVYLVREAVHTLDADGGYTTQLSLCSDSLCPEDHSA